MVQRAFLPQGTGHRSAFGDQLQVKLDPKVAIKAVYGARSDTETFTATGGAITATGAEFVLTTGTSVGGYGVLWSRRPLIYIPGVGAECRITARFTTGVANSLQTCGMFSAINGMFFGYNGTSFGVMHRYGGAIEIRKLTITAASNANTTATVTLNGVAYSGLAVTNSGVIATTAHEIATALAATAAATSWNIQHINDHIIFTYKGAGAQSGTYSASFTTGTGAGSFSQLKAGVSPTETWTPRASWSENKCGWLDPTKGNIYKLEYAYLGYGPLKFSVFDPVFNDFVLAHVIDWTNANSGTNLNNPSMRPGWVSASLGSTTDLTVAGASAAAFLQGENNVRRPFSASGTQAGVTTETQVLTLQVRQEFNSRVLNGVIHPTHVTLATGATKGAIFRLYRNPTVAGTTVHQYVDQNESMVLYDTGGTTVSGGRSLGTYTVGPNAALSLDLTNDNIELIAGDELVITAQVVSGAAGDMTASVVWEENSKLSIKQEHKEQYHVANSRKI